MTVALYMDEHVQLAIAAGLRARGIDVLTVQEDGHLGQPDFVLFARARELGRVIFSADSDHAALAALASRAGEPFPGVNLMRRAIWQIGSLVNDLEILCLASEPHEVANTVRYVPL